MNVSRSHPCATIWCDHDIGYPSGASCYWNVSFSTKDTIFPTTFDPLWFERVGPKDLLPRDKTACPGNTLPYSDCISGYNISTHLFGHNMISMNDSIDGGLACRLDGEDYCFGAYFSDGTQDVISVCKKLFDQIADIRLVNEWVSLHAISPIYIISMLSISLLFFVATFIIYTIIPELKNLHGLMLRTYISCGFINSLSTLLIHSSPNVFFCNLFILILSHFSLVACSLWVNVMAFDIWWTFRSMRKRSEQSTRKKYIIYSIYAWGIPTLIIVIALILELDYYMGGIVQGMQTRCWMMDARPRTRWYVEVPGAVPIVCNICLFALTIINIRKQKKATAQCLDGSESRRYNQEKQRFYLYLKLFILMGLIYIGDILPFVLQTPIPNYFAYALMVPEDAAGLIIFILFVCNDRTKQLLIKRLGMKDTTGIRTLLRRPQVL